MNHSSCDSFCGGRVGRKKMRVVVSLTLLLFELLTISAHALPSSKLENSPTSASDVYEVQESGKQKTTFFAPKPEKPTLREIVYYHVIETPYGKAKLERKSEPPQIEMDETMRPFTNGHGYQFADNDLHETKTQQPSNEEDSNDEQTHETTTEVVPEEEEDSTPKNIPDEIGDVTEKTIADEKQEITTERNKELPKTTVPSEEKKIRQRQFLFDRLRERYGASLKKSTTTEKPEVISSTEKAVITHSTEKVEISTTLESTTQIPANTPAVAKVKRSVNYEEIPVAPTLPSIDYSNYPGLQVFKEPEHETTGNTDAESNQDNLKRAMKFKINDIFATMKPYTDDDEETATHKPVIKVKTYGMNLSDDQGTVWNNMWRPINYHVGEPMKFYEVNEYQVSTITPIDDETTTPTPMTTTTKDLEDIHVDTKNKSTTPSKDLEDIYVDTKKGRKPNQHTTKKPDDTKRDEPAKEVNEELDKEEKANDEKDKSENVASRSSIHNKPLRKKRPTKETNPDIYEQLINSDKFWKWLAHWTSNYMEILSDRLKNMVKKEVAEQIKKFEKGNNITAHLNKTKDENKPNNTDISKYTEPVIKNNTLNVDGKKIPITNTSNLTGNVTNDFLRRHRDEKPNHNKLNKTEKVEKPNHNKLNETKLANNKFINNEVTPNATKKEENYNNVSAHNVYGSSTGNDQVTNVFIFYPGTETEKIIDSLKPYMGNTISGISTDKKDKNSKNEDNITEKPIQTSQVPGNFTAPKPVQDDKAEEKTPVVNKNNTKLEATKDKEIKKPDSLDSKEIVTEKNKDATEKMTERNEVASTTKMPKTSESPKNSTEITTEKSETTTSNTLASSERSTEKSSNSTTSPSSVTSSEKPLATTSAPTGTSTEKSKDSSTSVPVNSTTLTSSKADSTTIKTP